VSFDEWMLALHVLSAFAYVGVLILFWALIVAVRQTDTPAGTIRMEPIVEPSCPSPQPTACLARAARRSAI
jgi:hypothetical protein